MTELNYSPINMMDPELYDEFGYLKISKEEPELVEEESTEEYIDPNNENYKAYQEHQSRKKALEDELRVLKKEKERRLKGTYGRGTQFDLGALEFILNGSMGGLQSYYNQQAMMDQMIASRAADAAEKAREAKEKAATTGNLEKATNEIELEQAIKNRQNAESSTDISEADAQLKKKLIELYGDKAEDVYNKIYTDQIASHDNTRTDLARYFFDINQATTEGKLDYKEYNKIHGTGFKSNDELKRALLKDFENKYFIDGRWINPTAQQGYEGLMKITGYVTPKPEKSAWATAFENYEIQKAIDKKKSKDKFKNLTKPLDLDEDPSSSSFF